MMRVMLPHSPAEPGRAVILAMSDTSLSATPLSGSAVYFDGATSARHDVVVETDAAGLRIIDAGEHLLGEWPYAVLRRMSAPEGVLRLGRAAETRLARVEIRDAALANAIEERAAALDRSGAAERRLRRKIVALSIAAAASLIVTAIFGLPALAGRIIPLIPLAAEGKLGEAVDKEIRPALDSKHLGQAFACGSASSERQGRAALDKLVGRLADAAALPVRLTVEAVHRPEPNAVALPGGRIYVYEGLIAAAQTPDELAGVLAHEIGHVAHRDGTRIVLQTAGLSFLFGMMLGDFVGGGAVVIAARTVLKSSYSRRVETAADAYSVAVMEKAGGDPRALGAILGRIVTENEHGIRLLLDHPETRERIAAINAAATPAVQHPLLDATEWSALKRMCGSPPAKNATTEGNLQ